MALSKDEQTVFVTSGDKTRVHAFDVASAIFGQPLVTLTNGEQFRGIAAPPSMSPSATQTPSQSPTSSSTASQTGSPSTTGTSTSSNTMGATPTQTSSGSYTATITSSPTTSVTATRTGTMTTRGGALPASGFAVVQMGDGVTSIPNALFDVTVPLTIRVYGCSGACETAQLERVITPWSSLEDGGQGAGADRWGNRFITLHAGSRQCDSATNAGYCRATYRQGKLVPAGNDGSLIVAGYDVYAQYNLGSGKREPTFLELSYTGYFNVTTPCEWITHSLLHASSLRWDVFNLLLLRL